MNTQNLFVLNRLLHLRLCRIPLLLLLDKLLNFRCVQSRWRTSLVFNFTNLDHTFHLRLDVPIREILLIKKKLGVLTSQRSVDQSCLG